MKNIVSGFTDAIYNSEYIIHI